MCQACYLSQYYMKRKQKSLLRKRDRDGGKHVEDATSEEDNHSKEASSTDN